MSDENIKCCRRKCGWAGTWSTTQLSRPRLIGGIRARDRVCPKCQGKEFYILSTNHKAAK